MLDLFFEVLVDVSFALAENRHARRFVLAGVLALMAYGAASVLLALAVWAIWYLLMEFLDWPFRR